MADNTTYRARKAKQAALTASVLFVTLFLAFCLSGCKYSDVLTEHVEDPELGILDENVEPIYQENPNAEQNPDWVNRTVSDADDVDEQVEALPHYDPDALDNGPTKRLVHNEETPHDEEAAEGEEESGSTTSTGQGSNKGENQGAGDELDSDEAEDQGNNSSEAGAGGTTVIVDENGSNAESAKGTVAAVGEYATITQMLGGAGSLVAADQNWFDTLSPALFPGELDTVQVGWAGDGRSEGQTYTDRLINEIQPAVILWDGSAPALTQDDRERIEAAGIQIQVVPTLGRAETTEADIRQAIIEVASVLSGATTSQYDPIAMRDAYLDYERQVLQACYTANGGGYSYKASDGTSPHLYQDEPLAGFENYVNNRETVVFIDSLMHPGTSSITVNAQVTLGTGVISLSCNGQSRDVSDGVGLSVSVPSSSYALLDYYLQFSGIVNNAYDFSRPSASGRPFIIMAGRTADFGTSGNFASRSGVDSALWYNSGDGSVASNWKVLGSGDFKALLVPDEQIASAITASAAKSNGLYHMDSPYTVYTVPSGPCGSWAYGNADSFLVAPWSLRIRDASALSDAANLVSQFYNYFYRCGDFTQAVSGWESAYQAQ